MKKHEVAAMSKQELNEKIQQLEDRIADINFYKVIELPQNPMVFRNSRRDIARMKTQLHKMNAAEAAQH
ncbi:MAG: 50S ribosomal protein L29 [Chlorobium sp.]|jgi:large subunit ribosomal protein L29|uniref:50S ribosomal protein L29 n=1 Tax=Chlorobium sp. TaxID=1095 RepID=UPI001DC8B316|nr:50S ribosomal protein L29 [Chlorobium sp.]MBN1280008.1 50S ribosomal protein L29 [Chlorobiaceae bacterium]MCF8216173.1 50S ribosomal protein L29 [Chlorobium sp.]MCF8271036.1 50S ribosomal protein L29 [Chlorobium sp.]MCF8287449.1 50S ribosomal protein L29 [Chlorobium sp.]MCF8290949.1 50S ribosomal protein L29 [Chlorobium sp.]